MARKKGRVRSNGSGRSRGSATRSSARAGWAGWSERFGLGWIVGQEVVGLALIALGLPAGLALWSFDPADPGWAWVPVSNAAVRLRRCGSRGLARILATPTHRACEVPFPWSYW